jgi:glucose-6-phosphate dehydrogenase assembly protein OpcA
MRHAIEWKDLVTEAMVRPMRQQQLQTVEMAVVGCQLQGAVALLSGGESGQVRREDIVSEIHSCPMGEEEAQTGEMSLQRCLQQSGATIL